MPQQPGPDGMTRADRESLAQMVRRREKVAKTHTNRVKAERKAQFEEQIAAIYEADDARWQKVTAAAQAAVAEANARLKGICREQGIPPQFAPSLGLSWYGRNENYSSERRTELRRVMDTALEADRQRALEVIEERSVATQERLLAGGLSSQAAAAFLEAMPTPEQLMPPADIKRLEAMLPGKFRSLGAGGDEETDEGDDGNG